MIVPGLGLTHYLRRLVRELGRRRCVPVVLDVPGYGSRGDRRTAPDIAAIADAVAAWVRRRAPEQAPGRPLVLMGHSTGAQAALRAALDVQQHRQDASLVLAGPTFAPAQRRPLPLLLRLPLAYRHDPPWELDPAELLRAGPRDLFAIVRSGQHDEPERRVQGLRLPLTLTAGIHDALAPSDWLELLRSRATASPTSEVAILPGSHNNPWTHPVQLASLVVSAALSPRRNP